MADPVTWGIGISTILGAGAAYQMGAKQQEEGAIQSAINDVAATQVVAMGQRRAMGERKDALHIAKRTLALAASGGSADDIDNIAADIEARGAYNAAIAMHDAESEAKKLKFEGKMVERAGKAAYTAGNISAGATILGGASKYMDTHKPKYTFEGFNFG